MTYKKIVEQHFTPHPEKKDVFICKICMEEFNKNPKNGYQNVADHHQKCLAKKEKKNIQLERQQIFMAQFVQKKQGNYFSWLKWIIKDNLPLSFVESEETRANSRLEPVSRRSLGRFLTTLYDAVVEKISQILPNRFGLLFDGWSTGRRHFVAIFATYFDQPNGKPLLLEMNVLPDQSNQNALNHVNYIKQVLGKFGKSVNNVAFIVADNTNLNPCVANLLSQSSNYQLNFIGCASHRLNLALKRWIKIKGYAILLKKVHNLNKILKKKNNAGILSRFTKITPITLAPTRWSSSYDVIKSFIELEPVLHAHSAEFDCEVVFAMLNPAEVSLVRTFFKQLELVETVNKELQIRKNDNNRRVVDLAVVRKWFDNLIRQFPEMKYYLSSDAKIVKDKLFEDNIIDSLVNDNFHASLNHLDPFYSISEEVEEDQLFEVDQENASENHESSTSSILDLGDYGSKPKRQKLDLRIVLQSIPPTTVVVESQFSESKQLLEDQRKRLVSANVNKISLVKANEWCWEDKDVVAYINNRKSELELLNDKVLMPNENVNDEWEPEEAESDVPIQVEEDAVDDNFDFETDVDESDIEFN